MASVEHCLYCFEALSASLEKRTPMTLSDVQTSWAEYPKGLELDEGSESGAEEEEDSEIDSSLSVPKTEGPSIRNPTIQRLSTPRSNGSGTSTPASSSSSLEPSTAATTPGSSTNSFIPISISPQRSRPTTSTTSSSLTESPLFVTWNTVSPRSGTRSLRGCIGTFESLPLSSGLSSYALTSALSDHRFSPITKDELGNLEVSVTLLTDFETASDALDWEVGVHGVRISFFARNKRYGACYLPDVAVEQNWDKEETIISLMRKAGWGGRREKWAEVGDLKVVRFQGIVESVGWEEYRGWREWVVKSFKRDEGKGEGEK